MARVTIDPFALAHAAAHDAMTAYETPAKVLAPSRRGSTQLPWAVYRHYPPFCRRLLYVGVSQTSRLRWRTRQHERKASWWPQVDVIGIVYYATREEAEAAEQAAIETEAPLHNIAGVVQDWRLPHRTTTGRFGVREVPA